MAGHCGTIKGAHKCQLYVFKLSGPIRQEQSQSAAYQQNMHPNSCETLRSTLEKWFSITNVLMRFRQKRRRGRGSGLTMSQVALILLSSADRRSPGRRSGDNKKQKQQSPLSSFVHSQTGMFSNLIYNYVCILCGRPQKPADCSALR